MFSASRQRLLLAARNLSMLCVPEGVGCSGPNFYHVDVHGFFQGMNQEWDITYIVDGECELEMFADLSLT